MSVGMRKISGSSIKIKPGVVEFVNFVFDCIARGDM